MRADVDVGAWTLIVFARAPAVGKVKTRLAEALGAAVAARLHRRLVRQTLRRAAGARGARVELWIAGDPEPDFVQDCQRHGPLTQFSQRGDDLGQRMSHALADALPRCGDAGRCVLIGTDCPSQSAHDLLQAAAALRTHDVALQPALDGGYVLIGMNRHHPELFESIDWGSPRVCAQTEARAASLGLRVYRMRRLRDLDTEADLREAMLHGWIGR